MMAEISAKTNPDHELKNDSNFLLNPNDVHDILASGIGIGINENSIPLPFHPNFEESVSPTDLGSVP